MARDRLKVGHMAAANGEKDFGYINVEDELGLISPLPVGIINGDEAGPVLLITAGAYACEYAAVEAVTRLYKETKTKELMGGLILVPCLNLPALRLKTPDVCPLDNKNLNRSFPGKEKGSAVDMIAYKFLEKIFPMADYGIDCHGGDIGQHLMRMAVYMATEDTHATARSYELAKATGLNYIYCCDIHSGDDSEFGWAAKAAKSGIPSILIESGNDGQCDEEDVKAHVLSIKNVMKWMKMIPKRVESESSHSITLLKSPHLRIRTQSTGIFTPFIEPPERITKGQVIGEIRDLKAELIENIEAPDDGLLMEIMTRRVVSAGDLVFNYIPSNMIEKNLTR